MLTAEEQELLRYAARAVFGNDSFIGDMRWNPLVDDGDALRLAVKLGLSIHLSHRKIKIYYDDKCLWTTILRPEDSYEEFVRRAIVFSAAHLVMDKEKD